MSFMYPRIVAITRPIPTSDIGAIDPQYLSADNESLIASGIPANIQYDAKAQRQNQGLPGDIYSGMRWKVFIPLAYADVGLIKDNDIVTDDQGLRYQVTGAYWNSMGCNLKCERLQN